MFLVVFRFSWCNYSLIILYDGKTELESIFGGKLLKKAWNCSGWRFQLKGFDKRLKRLFFKQLLIFYSLKITCTSPDEEREVDLGTFVDQEEGDIDDKSDVDLDLDSRSRLGAQWRRSWVR